MYTESIVMLKQSMLGFNGNIRIEAPMTNKKWLKCLSVCVLSLCGPEAGAKS